MSLIVRGPRWRRPARPPWAHRRRSWREVELASLDFETTGLDRRTDEIVSFGVVPVRAGRIVVGDSLHRLVASSVPPSPGSMRIHGILPQDLAEAEPLEPAARTLAGALDRRFLVVWFAPVEIAFLRRLYGGRTHWWARRTVDVRQMAIALEGLHQDVRHTLSSTAERYGVPVASPHDALDDALVTAQLFLVLAGRLEERGLGTVGRLASRTRPAA